MLGAVDRTSAMAKADQEPLASMDEWLCALGAESEAVMARWDQLAHDSEALEEAATAIEAKLANAMARLERLPTDGEFSVDDR